MKEDTNSSCRSLLTKTKELLEAYPGTYMDIFSETKIQPSWLSALSTGKMKNPSVNKVQRLYEFLCGRPLNV